MTFKIGWEQTKLGLTIGLSKELVLFGKYNHKDFVFNNIILILKFCIYKSKVKMRNLLSDMVRMTLKNFS